MNDIQRILDNVIEEEIRQQDNFEDFDFVPDDDSAPDDNGYEPDYRDLPDYGDAEPDYNSYEKGGKSGNGITHSLGKSAIERVIKNMVSEKYNISDKMTDFKKLTPSEMIKDFGQSISNHNQLKQELSNFLRTAKYLLQI